MTKIFLYKLVIVVYLMVLTFLFASFHPFAQVSANTQDTCKCKVEISSDQFYSIVLPVISEQQ